LPPLRIAISRLRVPTSVGIYKSEKQKRQIIFISVELTFDTIDVTIDDMQQSVDYDEISAEIRRMAGLRHYELIENLAWCIGTTLKTFSKCLTASVRIDKPLAARKNRAETIAVTLEV
jgi:FolB domain-containing protein